MSSKRPFLKNILILTPHDIWKVEKIIKNSTLSKSELVISYIEYWPGRVGQYHNPIIYMNLLKTLIKIIKEYCTGKNRTDKCGVGGKDTYLWGIVESEDPEGWPFGKASYEKKERISQGQEIPCSNIMR